MKHLHLALGLACAAACAGEALNATARSQLCNQDSECPGGNLCLLGQCTDPRAQNLGSVDVVVLAPAESGMRDQVFEDVNTQQYQEHTFSLRPTKATQVSVCVDCGLNTETTLSGRLKLTRAWPIGDETRVESTLVTSDSGGVIPLLDATQYTPRVWLDDESAPILDGPVFFADHGLQGTLRISVPNPNAVRVLSGRAVASATDSTPMAGLVVSAWQGERDLVRPVQTAADGTFALRIQQEASSGVTLRLGPASGADPIPYVEVTSLNLNGDRNLGDVPMGVANPLLQLTGRITGPAGQAVPGAVITMSRDTGHGVLRVTAATDSEGIYGMRLPPGRYERSIVPNSPFALRQDSGVAVESPDSGFLVQTVDVALEQPSTLCGLISDITGTPVSNASVQVERKGNPGMVPGAAAGASFTPPLTISDGEGRYCMPLGPGRYLVTAVPRGQTLVPSRADLIDIPFGPGQPITHDFDLPRAALLAGVVLAPNGAPVATTRVKAYSPVLRVAGKAVLLAEGTTDSAGHFTLVVPDLAPTHP